MIQLYPARLFPTVDRKVFRFRGAPRIVIVIHRARRAVEDFNAGRREQKNG